MKFGPRTVIDDTLADGHALWVADVDGDGDDEIFAGHRGKDHRVSMYDFDRTNQKWKKTVIDRDIAAQDLRGGDLDGDHSPDVVAVGGSTHNVVLVSLPKKGLNLANGVWHALPVSTVGRSTSAQSSRRSWLAGQATGSTPPRAGCDAAVCMVRRLADIRSSLLRSFAGRDEPRWPW